MCSTSFSYKYVYIPIITPVLHAVGVSVEGLRCGHGSCAVVGGGFSCRAFGESSSRPGQWVSEH